MDKRFAEQHKDPVLIDQKLMAKYGVRHDRMQAMREHRQRMAKVKYLRWRERFFLLATDGESSLFEEECVVDLRVSPIHIGDYTVRVINGKPSVRLSARCYKRLRHQILTSALSPKVKALIYNVELESQTSERRCRQSALVPYESHFRQSSPCPAHSF